MEWTEYRVLIASQYVDLVAEFFHRLDSGGVVIEEQSGVNGGGEACLSVKAYFPASEDKSEAIKLNLQAIRRDHGADCRLFPVG
ncbi:MAG: hypothetical protein Q4B48_00910 [Syntrophomonadaceae bacterium]|nr:hypothetical protein [Syntrophomonadaceae bacterium]